VIHHQEKSHFQFQTPPWWRAFSSAASTTAASSSPYTESYIYNTLGNLLFKGPEVVSTTTVSTNTHSLDVERSSSQYASISDANQVGLDLTPPLTISMWIKTESAPGNLESRDMVAKYNPGAGQRAYRWTYQESSDCGSGNTCMVCCLGSATIYGSMHLICLGSSIWGQPLFMVA